MQDLTVMIQHGSIPPIGLLQHLLDYNDQLLIRKEELRDDMHTSVFDKCEASWCFLFCKRPYPFEVHE